MALIQLTDEYGSLNGVGGTCALCNASKRDDEKILTTNLVTDMKDAPDGVWPEQWMEFCETCVTEMGHLVNMHTEAEVRTLQEEVSYLLSDNEDLRKQLDEAKLALTAFVTIREHIEASEKVTAKR